MSFLLRAWPKPVKPTARWWMSGLDGVSDVLIAYVLFVVLGRLGRISSPLETSGTLFVSLLAATVDCASGFIILIYPTISLSHFSVKLTSLIDIVEEHTLDPNIQSPQEKTRFDDTFTRRRSGYDCRIWK